MRRNHRRPPTAPAFRACPKCGYEANAPRTLCPRCGHAFEPQAKKDRAKPRHFEDAHQKAFFDWAALAVPRYPDAAKFYHVPNGGSRSKGEAGRLKAQGVRAGVLDLSLDVARGGYFGLRIELKATRAELGTAPRVSPEQRKRIDELREDGYYADVAEGWEQAVGIATQYMRMPRTQAATGFSTTTNITKQDQDEDARA